MIEKTEYYDEFLRYYNLANEQQQLCNVSNHEPHGMIPHLESNLGDDLMEQVELYDVVERAYAGFSQIVQDCFHGWSESHPYWKQMQAALCTDERESIAKDWTGKQDDFDLPEWLFVFILHRVCGSAINYSYKPSGYYNTILPKLYRANSIEKMTEMVKYEQASFYTNCGYQFPAFPKPADGYKKGGDYYLCEYAPRLARDLADWLVEGDKKDLREIGYFMLDWNTENDLRRFHFQYAAVVADVADWFPQYVNRKSLFYYGTNAINCISYLGIKPRKQKTDDFLDEIMMCLYEDTGSYPYNCEDVCCDFIRYLENYIRPGGDYDHLDFDGVWNSSQLVHPHGRQKAMLELGLVKTFNDMTYHPSGDKIIAEAGMTPEQYCTAVKSL